MIGTRLGDFEIVRELGRGGMGVVYEAVQVSLRRRVALKVLAPGLGLSGKAVDRFRREAEAAARLHHTNIVPVYATGEQDGVHYYAMELIAGPSLDRVIKDLASRERERPEGAAPVAHAPGSPNHALTGPYIEPTPLSPSPSGTSSGLSSDRTYFDTVAKMVADVADALDHAHAHGVLHRDVKPSNLLLGPDGRLSVNDFGLARLLEQPGVTLTGEFVGTPAYMSPEQVAGGRVPIDRRTDVYSLGATLYELLTLRPPFAADRRDQLLAMVVQKEPAAPRRVNPRVPVDLETICLTALEKDPDRRYPTAGRMADDLRRYGNRFAIAARRVGPLGKAKKWVKRNPWVAGLAVAVAVATGVAGLMAYQRHDLIRQRMADEAKARQALQGEKVRQTQQRVLQGDFPGAEEAIREALDLGARAAWADWRRGQIAYHRGELGRAVELLDRAVTGPPENPAARALLASAAVWSGHWDKYNRVRDALVGTAPATPEDFLYVGLAYSYADPAEGLRLLDGAVRDQPSLIAHVIRAQVRADQAMHTSDAGLAAAAVGDATAAKVILHDNPTALCTSVWVHQIASALYPPPERERATATAQQDADALAEFTDLPQAVLVRGWFLDSVGREDEAARVWATGLQNPLVATHYALYLYRRGNLAQARAVAAARVAATPGDRIDLAWFSAENPDRHAAILADLREYTADLPAWRRPLEYGPLMFLLGRKAEAVAMARADLAELGQAPRLVRDTYGNAVRYLANPSRGAEDELLREAGPSKRLQTSAHFLIGLSRLADGDRARAREHFEAAVASRCFYNDSYDWSRAFLARMAADPTWPLWIERKK